MGKCLKTFSSDTSKPIQSKHCMNGHWMDLCKSYVFCANQKFKVAATSRHNFNIGPCGKHKLFALTLQTKIQDGGHQWT